MGPTQTGSSENHRLKHTLGSRYASSQGSNFYVLILKQTTTNRPKRHGTHPFRLIIAATSLPVGKTPNIFGDLQGKAPPKNAIDIQVQELE